MNSWLPTGELAVREHGNSDSKCDKGGMRDYLASVNKDLSTTGDRWRPREFWAVNKKV